MSHLLKTTTNTCALLCAALLAQSFNTPFTRLADASAHETPRHAAPTQASDDDGARTTNADATFGALPLTFETNRGQAPTHVEYLARSSGYTLMLTRAGALLSLKSGTREASGRQETTREATLRMSFPGADPAARPVGRGLAETKSNYLKGRDPSRWLTGVENYESVVYERVYEGVDLVFHGSGRRLEYDFRVAAGADAGRVKVRFDGAGRARLDADGALVLPTRAGEVRQPRPFAYQEDGEGRRTQVACDYVLGRRGEVGFRLGAYDRTREMVIDPTFVYSTYLGVPGGVQGIASDAGGNAYMTGTDGGDVLVLKINPAGTGIIYATHVGGSGTDAGLALAINGFGNAFVTGTTDSPNFPTSGSAFDKTCGNSGTCNDGSGIQSDAFVFELNTAGSNFFYSTYLGGSGTEPIPGQVNWPTTPRMGIALNGDFAFVTGSTTSVDFPTTAGAFSTTPSTSYVVRLNTTGSALLYSTYFPGAIAQAVAVDVNNQAYITGMTTTSDGNPPTLPVVNAYQPTLGGQFTFDAFAAKLNSSGTALVFSTFLGGREGAGDTPRGGDDYGNDIAFDSSGNVYVVGGTRSGCFPDANPYVVPASCPSGGGQKEFLVKFSPPGNALLFSKKLTTLVSADGELSVEPSGSSTVAWSCQHAATLFDVCVDRVSTDGATEFTTSFGGSANERVTGVLAGGGGQVYVVGKTASADYPVTPGALHTTIGGATDSFAARFSTNSAEIRFDAPSYDVAEGAGKVTVRINRSGNIADQNLINYTTEDVTASSRADYTAAIGSVFFEPGETFKLVDVFITDDAYGPEGDETFNFKISSAGGLSTGTPATATVRILDNDAAAGPNPIEPPGFSPDFFVRQHYIDFLSREPDAAGLAFWKGELSGCGSNAACLETKRINVSAAFFLSIEFQETGYYVERIYKTAFGDTTSPGVPGSVPIIRFEEFLPAAQRVGRGVIVGPGPWQQQLDANKRDFALETVQSVRFQQAFPFPMTTEQLVDKLNQNAGGVLSQAERDQLVADVNATAAVDLQRALALRRVAEDEDLKRNELRRAFVLMEYFGYLRRNPDDAPEPGLNFGGWKFWLDKLNEFNGDFVRAEMVKAFLNSDEYRHRFGP